MLREYGKASTILSCAGVSLFFMVGNLISAHCQIPRRELVDPCVGAHWKLVSDPVHPEQPGKLVLLNEGSVGHQYLPQGAEKPIVRSGERVVVEQETQRLHSRLYAVALESAATGQRVRVRLVTGTSETRGSQGRVITVIAKGPGVSRWLSPEGFE